MTWDLGTRVFDEANPILPGLFLLGPRFHLFLKIRGQKVITQNSSDSSGFSLSRAFQRWSRNCCSPSGLLANCFFVCVSLIGNPAEVPSLRKCRSCLWQMRAFAVWFLALMVQSSCTTTWSYVIKHVEIIGSLGGAMSCRVRLGRV